MALAARATRDARAARDAQDAQAALAAQAARDARDTRKRFAVWCIQGNGWWWYRWDLSWICTTWFGARQLAKPDVEQWSLSLLHAFLNGAWLLHWTEDVLYWVAKPTVHMEQVNNGRQLHNDRGPALESDVENLYFWHGVYVPAFVVTQPDWITVTHIQGERNVAVRRVMMERYGQARFIRDSGAQRVQADDYGDLYRTEIEGDEPLVMVRVTNGTPELDGTYREYWLRVPPSIETARAAVAWTFDAKPESYDPTVQT